MGKSQELQYVQNCHAKYISLDISFATGNHEALKKLIDNMMPTSAHCFPKLKLILLIQHCNNNSLAIVKLTYIVIIFNSIQVM